MRRQLLVVCFLVLTFQIARAQKYDVGLNIGASGYMGEINQRNPVDFNRGGFGGTFRVNLNPDFSVKFGLSQILLHGADANSGNAEQVQRNLRFNTWVTEASAQFEFNFFKFNPFDNRESYSPYIFAGAGLFHFNPYTFLDGHKVFLHNVGTEGQFLPSSEQQVNYPKPYSRISGCIPIGFGFKYHLGGHLSMIAEYGFRITFTDYLDDIGGIYPNVTAAEQGSTYAKLSNRSAYPYVYGDQRGDSWKYDKYFYANVGIIYTFRSINCPTFSN